VNYDDDDRAQLVDNVRDAVGQVEDAQLLLRIDVFSALVAGRPSRRWRRPQRCRSRNP